MGQHLFSKYRNKKGGEYVKTFQQRYYELLNQFLREGQDVLDAMQRAVAQIQYEVRCGIEYPTN